MGGGASKPTGGVLGTILMVAVLGYKALSGQLSPEQLLEELLGGGNGKPTAGRTTRKGFPNWSDAEEFGWKLPSGTPDPESCDARDAALIRDGKGERVEEFCDVVSGEWFDPYGGQTYADPSDLNVDHIVPLANAWRSSASSWDTAKRENFANAPRDLLSVDDGLNQSKADNGPEAWKPPRKAYWCTYSKRWIGIKHYFGSSR